MGAKRKSASTRGKTRTAAKAPATQPAAEGRGPMKAARRPKARQPAAVPRRVSDGQGLDSGPHAEAPITQRTGESPEPSPLHEVPRTRVEHVDFDDAIPKAPEKPEIAKLADDPLVHRWVDRGQELLRRLTMLGAADCEYRADLRGGRFMWIRGDGSVVAQARTQVLCCWARSTATLMMAWADPLLRAVGVERIDGMPAEKDETTEAEAWAAAMRAAESCGAEYIYRVPTPLTFYFLALSSLRACEAAECYRAGNPVGLVLRGLGETREAIASRAVPADVIRQRLMDIAQMLRQQAEYGYRGTDWVSRLDRTGRTLHQLAGRLAPPTFGAVAAGVAVDDWIDKDVGVELLDALALLEDEWQAFS